MKNWKYCMCVPYMDKFKMGNGGQDKNGNGVSNCKLFTWLLNEFCDYLVYNRCVLLFHVLIGLFKDYIKGHAVGPLFWIDLAVESVNGLRRENHFQSQQTLTLYKIKVNNSKLIDLEIRIESTLAILMPCFLNFLKNLIINFHMLLYFGTYFLRVTVLLLCQLQAVSNIHVPIYPCLICEGRRNC